MGKTIRKTIQITTRKRHNGVKINEEFYSYDKNNAQFEFIMDYDIPADKVIALFHFENSNRYYETLCQFKGNLITIEFDTSLIVEDELVTGYLYFDKLEKSTDVYRFTFGARLSEIDKTRELPVQEKVSRRIVPVADIVTKQELKALMDKIKENGGTYDDTEIRSSLSSISERVQTLENKPVNDDSDVKSRLNALENNASRYLTEHQSLTSVEERIQQVEARFNNLSNIYLTSHQSLEHLAAKDALNKIEQRVEQLENKPGIDVTNFATNTKVEAVEARVQALENKPSVIPQAYDDRGLKQRLTNLENRPQVDLTDYAKKSEIPNTTNFATTDSVNNLLRAQGEQATKLSTLEAKSAYEIHGTGMPNGKVSAPIGTTYVDMEVTNGALKWRKEGGNGDRGWKVLTGDTGWKTLPVVNKLGNAKIQIRRINDEVIVKFDGLQYGWFGMKPTSQQEYSIVERSVGTKNYTWVKVDVGNGNDVIPEGFRSSSSILSGLYGDLGDLLGSVYLGGKDDSNALQLRYAMPRNEVTDTVLSQIRISPIIFLTDDDYPTTLP